MKKFLRTLLKIILGFIQIIVTVIAAMSVNGSIKECFIQRDYTFCEYVPINVMIMLGSALFVVYIISDKESIFKYANMSLLVAYFIRFIDVSSQCLFSVDVPGYSIFVFGMPSALALVSTILILKKVMLCSNWSELDSKVKVFLVCNFVYQLIILIYPSLVTLQELRIEVTSELLQELFYVTLFITNCTMMYKLITRKSK